MKPAAAKTSSRTTAKCPSSRPWTGAWGVAGDHLASILFFCERKPTALRRPGADLEVRNNQKVVLTFARAPARPIGAPPIEFDGGGYRWDVQCEHCPADRMVIGENGVEFATPIEAVPFLRDFLDDPAGLLVDATLVEEEDSEILSRWIMRGAPVPHASLDAWSTFKDVASACIRTFEN